MVRGKGPPYHHQTHKYDYPFINKKLVFTYTITNNNISIYYNIVAGLSMGFFSYKLSINKL